MSTGGTIAAADSSSTSAIGTIATLPSKPRRGGTHPRMGLYQGGSKLSRKYELSGKANYKFTAQLRDQKILSANERSLQEKKNDSSVVKFNGSLDIKHSSTELNKEEFQMAVKELYRHYGLQTFFFAPKGTSMLDLTEDYHMFTLEEIIDEYESRLVEPSKVIDPLEGS